MKTWYSIKAKADDRAEISIFDEIGFWGVTAKDFIAELKAIKGKALDVLINSPGGSVFDALAIYNALRSHGSEITVKVMGIAASAASLIAMAGDKIVMPANTFMMIHNPIGAAFGNAEDMRELADILDKIGGSLVLTYVARTGLDEKEVRDLLDAETWLTAEEAVGFGFADELEPALKIAASFETDRLPENIKAVFAAAQSGEPGDGEAAASAGAGDAGEIPDGDGVTDQQAETLADQINAAAAAAGLAEFAGIWAVDQRLDTIEAAAAAIAEAREIRALCAVAKLPEKADELIRARLPLAEARAKLQGILAAADEATHTDTTIPAQGAKPAAKKASAVWAKILPSTAVH